MENIKPKSLKLNMILNGIRGLMALIFPLISFPYVSKVLGVETVGKYNFATSVISYFILLAGLGINTYAIREGARCRDNKEELSELANQIFTINFISTIISYILLIILIIIVPKFHEYMVLLIILSLQIIFKTIGIEWLYSIYEDYMYITVRSIIFQILSLLSLLMFVKTENDVNIYAIITVVANAGANLLNYIHSRRYCRVKLTKNFKLLKHLRPIMILFAMNLTVSIYANSDITILGFLDNDYVVGIYSVSTKVYGIVENVILTILTVSLPRLAALLGKEDKKQYNEVASEIYKTLFTLILPAMIGIILLRKDIVLIVSNMDYIEATTSLMFLSISLIFVCQAFFWSQCTLIPYKRESVVLKATIVSALANVILNFILIPIWHQNAAAFTTIIAEAIVFVWCRIASQNLVKLQSMRWLLLKVFAGCLGIIISVILVNKFIDNYIIHTIVSIVISIIVYGTIEILLKNEVIFSIFENIKNKILKVAKKEN